METLGLAFPLHMLISKSYATFFFCFVFFFVGGGGGGEGGVSI